MTTYVINGENSLANVEIEFPGENNRRELVFIQAKSKAKIPPLSRVTRGFLMDHPKVKATQVDSFGEYTEVDPIQP